MKTIEETEKQKGQKVVGSGYELIDIRQENTKEFYKKAGSIDKFTPGS